MKWRITLAETDLGRREIAAAERVLRSGWVSMGDETRKFEAAFGAYAGGLNVREAAIRRLLDAEARVALLGRDRLHLFPIAAAIPDPLHPASVK